MLRKKIAKDMENIKTLIVKFDGTILDREIPQFRGAVIAAAGGNLLFHNHQGDGYRYSYPLIQYKKIGRNPAIVCIGAGVESIGKLFENGNFTFDIGGNVREMEIVSVKANKTNVQLWNSTFNYSLRHWLALNPENYKIYNSLTLMTDKITLLEKILKGNILSFLKGMDIFIDGELECSISNLSSPYVLRYKGVGLTAFNVDFVCNLSIPHLIGLGKNAALGFGVLSAGRV